MNEKKPTDLRLLWRVAGYGWAHRGQWIGMFAATISLGVLSGSLFLFMKLLLDALMGRQEPLVIWFGKVGLPAPDAHQAMIQLGTLMLILSPLIAALAYAAWYTGQWLASTATRALRAQLIGHLIDLDLAFHSSLQKGDLLTRMTTDMGSMQALFQNVFGKILQRPLVMLGTIGTLFIINWAFAAAIFLLLLPIAAVLIRLLKRVRKRSRTARKRMAENMTALEQITSGVRVIKAMGSADAEVERYDRTNGDLFDARMGLVRTRAQTDAVTNGAVFALSGACLLMGAMVLRLGWMPASDFITFLVALGQLTSMIRQGGRSWNQIQETLPSGERVFELLDRPSAIVDRPDAKVCVPPNRSIRFDRVTFSYDGASPVLREFSLDIAVGSSVALVGESGSGKTTILNLLPRFYDVQAGAVRFDEVDLREYQQRSLAHLFAIVQQDSFLFNDTVAANIRYGRPGATNAEVETAARRAHVHEAILALEGGLGYATVVGDRGERLSGGQRQRVAIARALLRDAPVLLLDEPTSALDADSESHIQAALKELLTGRTSVMIAHRLATIQHCDIIFVLGKGQGVIEQGTHAELLAKDGEYARLVRLQTLK